MNFIVFCNYIIVLFLIKVLLDDLDMMFDGFVGLGYVFMVIGIYFYDFIVEDYGKLIVVVGFELFDLLQLVLMVLEQICDGWVEVEN